MTLKQAFTIWACAPSNTVLAAKSREAVQRVLMKKWNDIDLEQFSESFCRRIFYQSTESLEMKVKAASILIYVLQWGGDNGHCQRPTFTYDIASEEHKRAEKDKGMQTDDVPKQERIVVKSLAEVKADVLGTGKPTDVLPAKTETKVKNEPKEENMEQKRQRGKQPKPVAQLDVKTLQVIKVWPSRSEAERELGACNLDRAINRKRMSAGFFWCAPEDADGFQPNPMSKFAPKSHPNPKVEKKPKSLVDKFNKEQQELEQMKREGKIAVTKPASSEEEQIHTAARDALEVFTDDELLEELDRRGWQGELRRMQVVSIGKE